MEHFGLKVYARKHGLYLDRDNYAIIDNKSSFNTKLKGLEGCYKDEEGRYYTDEWCEKHRGDCLKNFDLNMKFYRSLSKQEFNGEINAFITKNQTFTEVFDLGLYAKASGYYLMVLDRYCQIYIGTTNDIKRRIQQHWSIQQKFDRLLFPIGAVEKSVLSIDCFRALDTTRIFAYKSSDTYIQEDEFINEFSPRFICNRVGGGKLDGDLTGMLNIMSTMKQREL